MENFKLYRFSARCSIVRRTVSALTLFVPRVLADHAHDAVAPDDLAMAADFLH
jgi:hypothetical protein